MVEEGVPLGILAKDSEVPMNWEILAFKWLFALVDLILWSINYNPGATQEERQPFSPSKGEGSQ
ncbi:hypothetical protein M231_03807 [Tremella mesenterica]|uniref:Uncharacterized protein n=1 Tax=Tremella mesenterica TaxID=5217 RepID=A0A4Q1BMR8_TREME|nr:hypothetical protein M231_03807 [Tremella mesenterica]